MVSERNLFVEVVRLFPDDSTAGEWFATRRQCPHCVNVLRRGPSLYALPLPRCDKRFSASWQTALATIYRDLTTALKGVSKLHRDLGISQKSAWHLAHRIRRSWEPQQGLFAGPVEVDETYIGGKPKATSTRAASCMPGGGRWARRRWQARGTGTRTRWTRPRWRGPGKTSCKASCAGRRRRARAVLRRGGGLCRDGGVRARGGQALEYVRGQAHVNGLESFRALLKRGYHGTYHHMSPQHLKRYVTEFAGRHNNRRADTAEQIMVHGLLGKTLTYRQLTGQTAAAC